MKANDSRATFTIQPRRLHIWGELWHAMAFTFTGTGGALYAYLFFLGLGAQIHYTITELIAIGMVFLGALIIFTLELTYRSVFLRYFFSNLSQSWISRGVVALFIFGALSVLSLLLGSLDPGTETLRRTLTIVAGLAALFVIIYPSLLFSSTAVPFWRSGLLPLEFLVSGAIGGLAVVALFTVLWDSTASLDLILLGLVSLLAVNLLLHLAHLRRIPDSTKKETVQLLTKGDLSSWFLGGFVTLGALVPIALVIGSYLFEGADRATIAVVAGVLAFQGVFAQRYWLLKAGVKPALL